MKDVIATQSQPEECFVLQMDGKAKSQHRRFVDALRAGLQLRGQFPVHDVKVRDRKRALKNELLCTDLG